MQTSIVIIVLACSIAYAVFRIYDSINHAGNSCRGCGLAEVCNKRNAHKRRHVACEHRQEPRGHRQ